MTKLTQEMLDAWAKIPRVTDRPQCRVCRSTDVTLFTFQATTHRWEDSQTLSSVRWVQNMIRNHSDNPTESMGCNECKTLDQPVLEKFSLGEWP